MENRAGGNAWYFGDTHTSINEIYKLIKKYLDEFF